MALRSDLYQKFLACSEVSIDTRSMLRGAMFFALKGERYNANDFIEEALSKGASCVVAENEQGRRDDRILVVEDVLATLQDLAKCHRQQLGIPIIGITGSNGKTTTKELLYSVLSCTYKAFATKGNLNNHIGVPLTLLSMDSTIEMGIVEMGANHQGEIDFLCSIALPDYGYITNFGLAHLEGFGGKEGVIKGKSELYRHLESHQKIAFVNQDDAKQLALTEHNKRVLIKTNVDNDAIKSSDFVGVCYKKTLIKSNLTGDYNRQNIMAAIGIGTYFKVSVAQIKTAIESYQPSNHRSQIIEKANHRFIADAYNANPTSMSCALKHFKQIKTDTKIAILGDMFELGDYSAMAHQEVADFVAEMNLQALHLVGEHFLKVACQKATKHKTTQELIEYLEQHPIPPNSLVLLKGSRGMQLEKILSLFQ